MNSDPLLDGTLVLPDSIIRALRQLIRRARHLIVIRGACACCAVGLGAFLAIMLVDAGFTLLARWPRWLMTIMAYSAWAGALFWFLIRPLTRSFTLTGIARLIEAHHPELQERLSSAVEILSSKDIPAIRGSDVLIGALTEEAVRDAVILKPKNEISFRGAIPYVVAAGIVLTVLATLWLVKPRQTRFLLARAAAPFLNLPNVQATDLYVEPGDALIASGSRLRISIRTASTAVVSARLRQLDRQGRETVTDMVAMPATTNQPGRTFAVTLPAVLTGFRYRIHAGDALTRYFTVRVAIPPIIEHLDVRCRYPDYSRLGVLQERDGSGTLRALVGSEVTVSTLVNKPVSSAAMVITTASSTNTIKGVLRVADEGPFYDFGLTLPANLNGSWTVSLVDEIGLRNAPFDYAIQAIPDSPPIATVVNLRQREVHLNRDARLPVTYSAEDDLGLTGMALVFTVSGTSNDVTRSLPLPTQAGQNVRAVQGETVIALDDPFFADAPRVTFRLRATDNLPGTLKGPQSGNSETFTIILDERAPSWPEQVLTSQDDRAQQGLKQVQQKLASARDQARALDTPLAQQPTLNSETARKIDTLQDSLASADNALRNVAADLDQGFFEALATNLTALAENHVSKAENLAGQLRLVDSPVERTAINSNVTAEIDTSLRAVERAIQDHQVARPAVHRAVELDRLTDKQAALARTRQASEQAAPPDASNAVAVAEALTASNTWQKAQDQVADRLGALAKETPEQVAAATSNLTVQAANQATELATRQNELAALTQKQTDRLQNQDREWHDLAARQDQLATLARQEPLSALQNPPMQQAAKDLAAANTDQALQTQAEVAEALRKEVDRLLETPAPLQAKGAPDLKDLKQTTAEALQKADDGLKLARQAAQRAELAADRAEKRADADAVLVKQAEAAKKPELALELTEQAAGNRQNAKDARQWSRIAEQAAEQAKRSAAETRHAAEQAGREDQPAPARREAANQATLAAGKVEQFAEDARAAAHQAAVKSVERGSLQERAVQAEGRALEAARDARLSALKAGVTAERARQEAAQAEKRADQALVNGALPQQMWEARDKALDARAQTEAAEEAAAKSRNEALLARQESLVAQEATDKALWEESPTTTRENAETAELASEIAQQAAWRAEEQARLAEEAAKTPLSPRERVARAANLAAQQAAQAEQAAAAALKAAQAMVQPVAESQRLAEQAWETGQNELAKKTGQETKDARKQAEWLQALADAARKIAAESRQAANEAAEAERQAVQTAANSQTRNMEQAGAKAELPKAIPKQAKAADEPRPNASSIASEAQQAARQAQESARIAQQAAQTAQQATQKAAENVQQTAQQTAAVRHAAEQAIQQSRQSPGKPDDPQKTRRVQETQQAVQTAQQNEAGAQQTSRQAQEAAQQAAQTSRQAQEAAQQAAQTAQEAAQQAQQAVSAATPKAAQRAAAKAEKAAQDTAEKASEAANAAVKAAEQAATAAQKAAEGMAKSATEAQHLAEQAQWVKALADTAQKIATEAGQAAKEASEAEKQAGQAKDTRLAQNAEQAAQKAGAKADQADAIAEQAKAAAEPQPTAALIASEAQQAARQAQEASGIAQQASQTAQQAAQKAGETAQQTAAAHQTARQAAQTAGQAAKEAQQSNGKPDESDKTRRVQVAQQNAKVAQQNEAGAQRVAEQTQQAAQQAQQNAQQAQQAAQAAQQTAQAAQQAAQQSQQAASTAAHQVAQKARLEAEQAALATIEKAQEAANAAVKANESAEWAQDRLAALKLSNLATQQEGLRRQATGLLTEKEQAGKALRANLSERVAQQQQALATDAAELARDVTGANPPPQAAAQATQAAEAAQKAAAEWNKGTLPQARTSATDAHQNLDQLADTLRAAAAPVAAPVPVAEQSKLAELAQRADDLATVQDQLGRQMNALAANRPLEALQGQQDLLSGQIDDLAQAANVVRAQTGQVLTRTQAGPQADQAAREMTQAAQSADQAAQQMQQVARQDESSGKPLSQDLQQASERIGQAQQSAAQNLKQAAQSLNNAARAMIVPATPPTTPPTPSLTSPDARDSLAQAYGEARQAAESRQASDAAQSAVQLAQAADQAAAQAQSLGANARPATLQSAASGGGGQKEEALASEDVPSFARRLGMKLQDWLRLHGELKEDILQAAGSEGPEEYRPLIKRYFREVSGHGGEEQ